MLPLFERIGAHRDRPAIVADGKVFTFRDLDVASRVVASRVLAGRDDLSEARVALLIVPGFEYVATLLGIWRAGGIAVPLAISHPAPELDYVIRDADAAIVIASAEFVETLAPLAQRTGARFLSTDSADGPIDAGHDRDAEIARDRRALILYTSGTTGKPKGVVTTHANLEAQITSLVTAWGVSSADRALLVLPLHHVHGVVNVIGTALWAGATVEIASPFDVDRTWDRLASGELTVFTAVPTVYQKLIASWDTASDPVRQSRSAGSRTLRLMMSGSSALPVQTLERWRAISGHVLLERYGMTEIAMALSNPLQGERRPGFVGTPLPDVIVRLVDEQGKAVGAGTPGELEVRGPAVFLEYWRRPDETRRAFRDGWFRTGDVAVVEGGAFRLLGRTSVDIIKTGGYKVSALEVEDVLRDHPSVAQCAVVGIADEMWGEKICAAIELNDGAGLTLGDLQEWARLRLAPYKIPKELQTVDALPRNAMGKVVKPKVAALFGQSSPVARPST